MDRTELTLWVQAYERAWRSAGAEPLASIFTEDASYLQGPYHSPVIGLPAIAQMWDDERTGPDETFRMTHTIVAVEGDTAVVRVEVYYGDPVDQEYRDLWVIRFGADGRCRSFEEWPFWPSRAITAERDS